MGGRRWEGDERGEGIADARSFSAPPDESRGLGEAPDQPEHRRHDETDPLPLARPAELDVERLSRRSRVFCTESTEGGNGLTTGL